MPEEEILEEIIDEPVEEPVDESPYTYSTQTYEELLSVNEEILQQITVANELIVNDLNTLSNNTMFMLALLIVIFLWGAVKIR